MKTTGEPTGGTFLRVAFQKMVQIIIQQKIYYYYYNWWRGEFLNLPNPSGHTRPWGLLSL
jgi:hypothetical protein